MNYKNFIREEKWSGEVSTHWSPPEGLFTKSAEHIAHTLLKAGKSKAMKRLNFYMNRAGDKLENTAELEKAKSIIHKATSED